MVELKSLGDIYYGGQRASWSKGVVAGGTVYLSGVEGADPKTGQFSKDIETQTLLALEKAKERLAEAGSEVNRIVRVVAYVVDKENLKGFRKTREQWFTENYTRPNRAYASTLLVVAGLARPEMLVELDITAVVK